MIDRKNTITLGLPRVSDSEERNARQPREAGGRPVRQGDGRGRHLPREIEQIGGAGELDRDKNAGEGLGDDSKSGRGEHEPEHIADEITRDERRDARQSLAHHSGDERGNARSGRRHRREIDGGENEERRERHVGRLTLRRASALSASTREEKNIAA